MCDDGTTDNLSLLASQSIVYCDDQSSKITVMHSFVAGDTTCCVKRSGKAI